MKRELTGFDPRRPRALENLIDDLAELMGFDFCLTYRPQATATGPTIVEAHGRGIVEAQSIIEFFAHQPPRGDFAAYDPLRPDGAQWNRVVDPRAMIPYEELRVTATATWEMENGIHHLPELRVLVCGRRSILGWVGGYREEPFDADDYATLEGLIPTLRRRLMLEARLSSTPEASELGRLLDGMATPAMLTRDRDGAVVHANAPAQAALAAGEVSPESLREPRRGRTVTPLRGAGVTGHSLVTLDPSDQSLSAKLRERGQRWRLSRRQAEVLALVADGTRNATIAAELGVGLRAVERHVAALRRRARVETRAELVQAVWRDD